MEVWYGWVVLAASLAIHTIGMGAPTVLFVTLKPIALEFDWPRAGPSLAYSLMMIGSGIGGIAMGWWMDRRGVMYPVMFGAAGMGLGGWLGGAIFDLSGSYTWAFLIGFLLNLGNIAVIVPLALLHRRAVLRLQPA
jgi:predicted MFS family arabinose efflux permease